MAVHETGLNLTRKLAEILGLGDKPIRSIEIRAHCEEAVEVTVNMLVTKDQGGALAEELSRYELREKPEPEPEPIDLTPYFKDICIKASPVGDRWQSLDTLASVPLSGQLYFDPCPEVTAAWQAYERERIERQMAAFAILASRGHTFSPTHYREIQEAAAMGNAHALRMLGQHPEPISDPWVSPPGMSESMQATVAIEFATSHPADECTCESLLGLRDCPACLRKAAQ